jgi:acyl carrier protein
MDGEAVKAELKELLVAELNLAGKAPSDIDDAAPLFGDGASNGGLGLDSLDALQIAVAVEERFGVRLPEGEAARPVLASVSALAAHITRARQAAAPP